MLRPGWQRVALLPRAHPWSGDIHVHLVADAQASVLDERVRGVVLDQVMLSGKAGSVPVGQVILLSVSTALVALLTGWSLQRAWPGLLAGLVLALVIAAVLYTEQGAWRLMLTCYTGLLLLVLVLGGGLALAVQRGVRYLAQRGIVAIGPGARRSIAAAVLLAFVLRYGSMAYPLTYNSDIPIHMRRASLIQDGQFLALFLPNPDLTPVQWETDITIPYSPFYYLLITPALYLSGDADALAIKAFSAVVEALGMLLLALLALRAGAGSRAALLVALLAGMLPFGLLVTVSWGLTATLLGQFLALLAVTTWLVLRSSLHTYRAQAALAGALTLAYIAYPTTLLFLGTAWVALLLLLALRRDPATLPTLSAGVLAAVAALLLYYGWHIPALVSQTIPYMLGNVAGDSTDSLSLARVLDALWIPLRAKYGVLVPGLAAGGAVLWAVSPRSRRATDAALLVLAWCAAYPLFAVADTAIDLIHKHTLHMLPVLALLGGVALARIAQSRAGMGVVLALLGLILWDALVLELDMIVYAFPQLK